MSAGRRVLALAAAGAILALAAVLLLVFRPGAEPKAGGRPAPAKSADRHAAATAPAGRGGIKVVNPSPNDNEEAHVIAASRGDGGLFVGGFDAVPGEGNSRWRIEKVSCGDGSLVQGFGDGGVIANDPSAGVERVEAIVTDAAGRWLYAGGCDSVPGAAQWRVEKRDARTGAPNPDFGEAGVLQANPSAGGDFLVALGLDERGGSDGFLYLAGSDRLAGGNGAGEDPDSPGRRSNDDAWRIEKRRATDGALDAAFGADGVVRHNPSPWNDEINAIAIDPERGHLYAAGWDRVCGPDDRQWRVEKRRLDDGALVEGFGAGGVLQVNPSALNDVIRTMAIDPGEGSLYLAGWDNVDGNKRWRIEKRRLSDGAQVPGFGEGGVVVENPSAKHDVPKAIILDAAGGFLYLGGVSREGGAAQWRIEKRRAGDGGLVSSFGSGGAVIEKPGRGNNEIQSMVIDPSSGFLFLTGFQNGTSDRRWRIEKRSPSDGGLASPWGD